MIPQFSGTAELVASTPLELLRSRTHAAHEALHVHPFLAPLSEAPSWDALRAILIAFHGFHRGCASALAGRPLEALSSPQLDWLETDLATLGLSQTILAGLPSVAITRPANDAEALGILYVTEGSTLGGQQIARHLSAALGAGPEAGYRFFAGHGPKETGRRWKDLCRVLAALSPSEAEAAAYMADTVFTALADSLPKGHA